MAKPLREKDLFGLLEVACRQCLGRQSIFACFGTLPWDACKELDCHVRKTMKPLAPPWGLMKRGETGEQILLSYMRLLAEDLDEAAAIAALHGWKSSRREKGKELREKLGIEKPKNPEGK